MNWKQLSLGLALGCALTAAVAQQAAPPAAGTAPVKHTAQTDAGEPRANTSEPTVHASQSKPAPAPRARGTAAPPPPAVQ